MAQRENYHNLTFLLCETSMESNLVDRKEIPIYTEKKGSKFVERYKSGKLILFGILYIYIIVKLLF